MLMQTTMWSHQLHLTVILYNINYQVVRLTLNLPGHPRLSRCWRFWVVVCSIISIYVSADHNVIASTAFDRNSLWYKVVRLTWCNIVNWIYLVIPGFLVVEDNGWSETPGGVNAGSGNGDGSQVNHEHSKSNGKWCQYLFN